MDDGRFAVRIGTLPPDAAASVLAAERLAIVRDALSQVHARFERCAQ
jgi:hypothetical protein